MSFVLGNTIAPALMAPARSRDEVWRDDADELAGHYHLAFLPESRKMPRISRHQVVGAGGIGAFQKLVVVRVLRNVKRARGAYNLRMVLDEIEELLTETLADLEFRPRKHLPVFSEDSVGNVEPGGPGDGKQEDGALESVRFQGSRDEDVGIDDERSGIIRAWAWRRGWL